MIGKGFAEASIDEFLRGISSAKHEKWNAVSLLNSLTKKYREHEISRDDYEFELFKKRDGRTIREWIGFYDKYISYCEHELARLKKKKSQRKLGLIVGFIAVILTLSLFAFTSGPSFVGFIVQDTVDSTEDDSTAEEEDSDSEEPPEEDTVEGEEGESVEEVVEEEESEEGTEDVENETVIEGEESVENETVIEEVESEPEVNETVVENVTNEEAVLGNEGNETVVEENVSTGGAQEAEGDTETVEETFLFNDSAAFEPENLSTLSLPFEKVSDTIQTLQYKAVIGRPVKWVKTVNVSENLSIVSLPKNAENISILLGEEVSAALAEAETYEETIEEADREDIATGVLTGNVALDLNGRRGVLTRFRDWIVSFTITGNVISEDELVEEITETGEETLVDVSSVADVEEEVAVEYYTDAPQAREEIISKGKRVVVYGPSELNYTDILAYALVDELAIPVGETRLSLYWYEDSMMDFRKKVQYVPYDLDSDGFIDYIEWVVPHLSNQTYEIIIEITDALHLDSSREFISNIYKDVKELDENWSEVIPDGDFVRVTFEKNLTSDNDITVFPRTVAGNPSIEVYEVDEMQVLATLQNPRDNQYNTFLLTNLTGEQDTFDLKIIGGSLEFDHIIDPPGSITDELVLPCSSSTNCDPGSQTELSELHVQINYTLISNDDNIGFDAQLQFGAGGGAGSNGAATNVLNAASDCSGDTDGWYYTSTTPTATCTGASATCAWNDGTNLMEWDDATGVIGEIMTANWYVAPCSGADGSANDPSDIDAVCGTDGGSASGSCDTYLDEIEITTDSTKPSITLFSPTNTTYAPSSVDLNVTVDETIDMWWYEYNGNGTNVTFTPNSTINNLGPDGLKNVTVWANDTVGNKNFTVEYFTRLGTSSPETPSPLLNTTSGDNLTSENLLCSDTLNDIDGNSMNVSVRWYLNGSLNSTYYYNSSYANATNFTASLLSGNTSIAEKWSCSLRTSNKDRYSGWGNSSNATILETPPLSCSTLSSAGTYTMEGNLSSPGATCFTVTANDVTLDCAGYTITGDDTVSTYGIDSNYVTNLTAKNCTFNDFYTALRMNQTNESLFTHINTTGNTAFSIGISIGASSNNTFTALRTNTKFFGITLSQMGVGSHNNTFDDVFIGNFSWSGIDINENAEDNSFSNVVINGSEQASQQGSVSIYGVTNSRNSFSNISLRGVPDSQPGLVIVGGQVDGTTLLNFSVFNYTIQNPIKVIFEEAGEGKINFTQGISGTYGNLSEDIRIAYNFVYVNGSKSGLNKTANVTLYNIPTTYTTYEIQKDGVVCGDCYNFTPLNAGTVVFNVSGWSNHTIEGNTVPDTPVVAINSSAGANDTSEDLFCNTTISDPDGDALNVYVEWFKNAALNLTVNFTSQTNGTAFGTTLLSGNTTVDQNWSCSVRFSDGPLNSSWGSSNNITILDSASSAVSQCRTFDSPGTYTLNQSFNGFSQTCLTFHSDNIVVDFAGYKITGNSAGADTEYGINFNGYNHSKVINGNVTGYTRGVYMNHSLNNTLSGGNYSGNGPTDDTNNDNSGYAIYILNSENYTVSDVYYDAPSESIQTGGSCPFLYTWDGDAFDFHADLYPSGGVGYQTASGFLKPQPKDYYVFDKERLSAVDGSYDLRLVEERDEINYFDEIKLYAVEHPEGIHVAQELTGFNPYYDLHLYAINETYAPVSCVDDEGNNCTSAISSRDEVFHELGQRENLSWNYLELDFGGIDTDEDLALMFTGYSVWPGTTEGQAMRRLFHTFAEIEVWNGTDWINQSMYLPNPKEIPREAPLNFTGVFDSGSKVRLKWIHNTFIDQVYVGRIADVELNLVELDMTVANHTYHGKSEETTTGTRVTMNYSNVSEVPEDYPYFPGNYTKYGDVSELLTDTDDKYVVFELGSEVQFEFDEYSGGSDFDFLVYTFGHYKIRPRGSVALNISAMVEDLPFEAMSNYPYNSSEWYPNDTQHLNYLSEWNTRNLTSIGHYTKYGIFVDGGGSDKGGGLIEGITAAGSDATDSYAIYVTQIVDPTVTPGLVINYSTINDWGQGITMTAADNVNIDHVNISSTTGHGIQYTGGATGSQYSVVSYVNVTGGGSTGLQAYGTGNVNHINISNSTFEGNNLGVHYRAIDYGYIEDTNITGNGNGLYLEAEVTNNIIARNNISGNTNNGTVIDNAGFNFNSIYNNYWSTNTNNIFVSAIGASNDWNTTLSCAGAKNIIGGNCMGGNYWDDYSGSDSDQNGIGDVNHTLTSTNIDWLPLVYDTYAPNIVLFSPTNTTYSGSSIDLNVTSNEVIDTWWYQYNGNGTNVTFSPNGTLSSLGSDGLKNVTVWANDTEGNLNFTVEYFTLSSNSAPVVYWVHNETMTDVSSGPNEGPLSTAVSINFSVSDDDGFGDLNDSTATINFSKNGETARLNTSCILKETSGNLANYSCTADMWWWDGAGTWNITASISDDSAASASNDSQTFALGTTAGFLTSPTNLTWSSINPGAVDQEPNEFMTLNNTGNMIRSVDVNATNLFGEDNSAYALWAANFSSHTASGCGGTTMSHYAYTTVSGASVAVGNYTINDGTGQEAIYYCLEAANSDLIAQAYSTADAGSWTIRIFAVLLSARGKKRKKKPSKKALQRAVKGALSSLQEKYSLSDAQLSSLVQTNMRRIERQKSDMAIPLEIFSTGLGALEALVKYMRENLEMRYSEIGKALGRNERTIWASYHKARKKMDKEFTVKRKGARISLSEFNEKLTPLENLVVYLKIVKKMKYSEIGRLIHRDQRNVWTVYSRAESKQIKE